MRISPADSFFLLSFFFLNFFSLSFFFIRAERVDARDWLLFKRGARVEIDFCEGLFYEGENCVGWRKLCVS